MPSAFSPEHTFLTVNILVFSVFCYLDGPRVSQIIPCSLLVCFISPSLHIYHVKQEEIRPHHQCDAWKSAQLKIQFPLLLSFCHGRKRIAFLPVSTPLFLTSFWDLTSSAFSVRVSTSDLFKASWLFLSCFSKVFQLLLVAKAQNHLRVFSLC